jgi:hypothetical protein
VHAPVGLDIGAITPEEIAVAITAELIAVRRCVERDLPHMSWFHSHDPEAGQVDLDSRESNLLEGSNLEDSKEKL